MKNFIFVLMSFSLLTSSHLFAQASPADDSNPDWLLFTDEMANFIDGAQALYDQGDVSPSAKEEKAVNDLIETSVRMANIYFEDINSEVQRRLEKYLNKTITSHAKLRNYFILFGNAFLTRANLYQLEQKKKNKTIHIWTTVGGTLLGLATGGTVLYFKPDLVGGAAKSALLVVGTTVAGGTIGFGAGEATTHFIIPADPGVANAKAFLERYPSGEDFISSIENSNDDLLLGLNDIEDTLNDQ